MTFYLTIACLLWAAALVEAAQTRDSKPLLAPLMGLLCILSALRFETGYDWLVYEQYMEEVPSIWTYIFAPIKVNDPTIPMEQLYYVLNVVVKSLGGNLQLLMAVVAAFNFVVFYRFLRRLASPLTVLAAFYGWIFLSLHMAAIRQSIAISFILLALMQLSRPPDEPDAPWWTRRVARYMALIALGVGFQYSTIIYVPLYFVFTKRPPKAVVYWALGALLALYAANVSIVSLILDAVRFATPAGLAEKIDFYTEHLVPERSIGAMSYAIVNVVVFGVGLTALRDRISDTEENNALLNLSLLFCVLHLLSWEVPVFWQRVQYVAFAGQMALMAAALHNSRLRIRLTFWGAAAAASFAYMVFQLSADWAGPYIPYQNYAVHLVTGERGDGRDRIDDYYQALRVLYAE